MLLQALPEGRSAVLLAPTGKARVRLQAAAGREAKTVAQFLLKQGRYDETSQRYFPTGGPPAPGVRLVIVDEASMLTGDQVAALFDALEPGCRVVFVGDPQQLPPIGPGRPFVDLIRWLASQLGTPGLAKLKIRRRQTDSKGGRRDLDLEDVQFAELFSGRPLPAGEDEIIARVRSGESGCPVLTQVSPAEISACDDKMRVGCAGLQLRIDVHRIAGQHAGFDLTGEKMQNPLLVREQRPNTFKREIEWMSSAFAES